jgi:hypothetical protein
MTRSGLLRGSCRRPALPQLPRPEPRRPEPGLRASEPRLTRAQPEGQLAGGASAMHAHSVSPPSIDPPPLRRIRNIREIPARSVFCEFCGYCGQSREAERAGQTSQRLDDRRSDARSEEPSAPDLGLFSRISRILRTHPEGHGRSCESIRTTTNGRCDSQCGGAPSAQNGRSAASLQMQARTSYPSRSRSRSRCCTAGDSRENDDNTSRIVVAMVASSETLRVSSRASRAMGRSADCRYA